MYILDTDTLSLLHAGNPRIERNKDRFDPAKIVTTIITRIEVLRGRFESVLKAADGQQFLRALQWLSRSEEILRDFAVLPGDDASAVMFDALLYNKKQKKSAGGIC